MRIVRFARPGRIECNIVAASAFGFSAPGSGRQMRFIVAAAVFMAALALDVRPTPARAVHGAASWCVIRNTGRAEWMCFPTRALCRRYGERPGGGAQYCVQYPTWSGRG